MAAETQESLENLLRVRPESEWHEEIGPVLWWIFPITEAPYCGTPNDCGHTVEMRHYVGGNGKVKTVRTDVGGWPGYHTHWSPLPDVIAPARIKKARAVLTDFEDSKHDNK